jgi:DNA adenine methylase
MILNRLGNKTRIAKDIICHFPQHRTFIDMFFGAGGIYFNKPLADYNFCNDIDDDVFNLYIVLQNSKDELVRSIEVMPISESLIKYWNTNKEVEPIKKALRFLMLSNFIVNGRGTTLRFGETAGHEKKSILNSIEHIFLKSMHTKFMCEDFRNVLKKVQFRGKEQNAFIYCDPPYLGTNDNYSQSFTENDTNDLFDVCIKSKVPFAISEFDHPSVLELAKTHNLEVLTIGERQNLKNRRTEILVVNYESPALYSLFRNQEQSLLLV